MAALGELIIDVPALRLNKLGAHILIECKTDPLELGGTFTLEVWFRPDDHEATTFICTLYLLPLGTNPDGVGRPLALRLDKGIPVIGFADEDLGAAKRIGSDPWSRNVWGQIAIVCDQGNISADSRGSRSSGLLALAPGQAGFLQRIELGKCTPQELAGYSCNGAFTELRLWKRACTSRELADRSSRRLAGNEDDLIGYWMMDEAAGNSLWDYSLNDNDGFAWEPTWEPSSGPSLTPSLALQLGDHLTDYKLPKLDEKMKQISARLLTLADKNTRLEGENDIARQEFQTKDQEIESNSRDRRDTLRQKREEIEERMRALQKESDSAKIDLADFIEQVEKNIALSRSRMGTELGRVTGLDQIAMDIRMVPGMGGDGLHLPQQHLKISPHRLSTLRVRFRARKSGERPAPKLAPVPRLEGATEQFARSKIAAAGFRVEVVYQEVGNAGSHGRVIDQIYPNKPGQAALDSVITLVVGLLATGSAAA